ncbi:hypothetical protein IDG52_02390 [Pelagibacterales bacterium SAG-MED23]|nr:hypothetical protein [Pelagibacterales bacterium SAG-MED23]|tara:strand:- start:317 stop:790 length:474 start_codon:yes stop_codon:yes gene_type:complete
MNKFLIKYILILSIFLVTACSYKPIFSEKKYNFEINKVVLTGEKNINQIIKQKLSLIKKNEGEKDKYDLLVNSAKERVIFSKDAKGDPIKFELIVTINYEIKNNNKLLLIKEFKKSNIYNNETDKFELEQNEKIIVENLAEKISDSIISSIINLDDN